MRGRDQFRFLVQNKDYWGYYTRLGWATEKDNVNSLKGFFYSLKLYQITYKLGCKNSNAVGVHTPRIRRSKILIKPAPFPEIWYISLIMLILSDLYSDKTMEDFNLPLTKPVMNKIIQALGNNFAAWFTPSYTFLHLYIKFMFSYPCNKLVQ